MATHGTLGTADALQMVMMAAEPVIVSDVDRLWLPMLVLMLAVRVTGVFCETASVAVAVNETEVAPAGTVTEAGMETPELLEERATRAPVDGAAAERPIVQAVVVLAARLVVAH